MAFSAPLSILAQQMRPSPIRELFKVIQRPGMISLAGGLPDPAAFPVAEFAACGEVLGRLGDTALQYGATEGYGPLVEMLRQRMGVFLGRPVAAEQLLVTTGSQQAMDLLARALLDPGDTVVVEAPTYPGALHTFRNVGARFAVVPCDGDGMVVDALPAVLDACRRETGRFPRLIYTIINFSNPSGACLASGRRRSLADVAARYGIPVFEDDPYGELRYQGEALTPLFRETDGGVLYASSFSKILAPGVRVAWVVGEAPLVRAMAVVKQGSDLCTSVVSQVLVAEYCRRGHLDPHIRRMCAHYAGKRRALSEALRSHVPAGLARWHDPEGGFFHWLELAGQDSDGLFDRALDAGVAFLPGRHFFPDPAETVGPAADGRPFARLCFTFATPEQLDQGARRLATALAASP